jgi:molybdate transport system ATP-binding protein
VTIEVDVAARLGDFRLGASFTSHAPITALFGRSGAGKTSLINMIAGLLRPSRGRIAIDGRVLFDSDRGIDVPARKRRIGYIFQEGRLFPHLTVRKNLLYGRRFTPVRERHVDVNQMIELLDIHALLNRRPRTLSGGEKQRVAIGRALLTSPRLLLMDEPLASLDAARKADVLRYIERLSDSTSVPIMYVSHSIEEVTRVADALVVMSKGRVAAAGPLAEIMSRLELQPLTGRFEAGAVIEARVISHDDEIQLTQLAFAGGELQAPRLAIAPGAIVRVHIRARDVVIATRSPTGTSTRNVLAGRISEISQEAGPFAEVKLDIGETPLLARITRRSAHELGLVPGLAVFALIKAVALDRHSLGLPPGAARRRSGVATQAN